MIVNNASASTDNLAMIWHLGKKLKSCKIIKRLQAHIVKAIRLGSARAFQRLEPYEVKVSSAVLKGESRGFLLGRK